MINLKIKTNGTVRDLTLPYPDQLIPDIIEKDSVVTVSEVSEPESLKYMEGHEWNIDLDKRAILFNPHSTITNTLLTNRRNSAIIVIDIHYAIYITNY